MDVIENIITNDTDYADAFRKLGCVKGVMHDIKLDENVRSPVLF